jgi:cyanophycin synthetase
VALAAKPDDETIAAAEAGTPRLRSATRGLPLVAVGGRWGKTTVARLLEAMLQKNETRLALWTDQGVWVAGRRQAGELIPWGAALRSLAAGELDLAIQELDARTVVAAGLPPATYSLGIITSFCGNDRLCEAEARAKVEGQAQLAIARAVVPGGALILNADDHAVAGEGAETAGDLIYYSVARSNPIIRAHLAAGGRAVTVSSGMIVLCEGRRTQPVVPVREVPIAFGGAIVFQVQNALAAVAAAWHLGVAPAAIAATLCTFAAGPTIMPGSCNQFTIAGATVLVDRFGDAVSARALVRGLRKVPGRRRRFVVLSEAQLDPISAPEIGRLLGQSFDQVIIHHDAPGRPAGDQATIAPAVAKALRTSIARNRIPPVVTGVADEPAAVERLLGQIAPHDLALILAADARLLLRTLMTH